MHVNTLAHMSKLLSASHPLPKHLLLDHLGPRSMHTGDVVDLWKKPVQALVAESSLLRQGTPESLYLASGIEVRV